MTTESDIYAFGVTLWEMFSSGKRPYDSLPANDVFLPHSATLVLLIDCSQGALWVKCDDKYTVTDGALLRLLQ